MATDSNVNRYNPAAKTTYEDVTRQRKLAEEENYTPATLPETTTPLVPIICRERACMLNLNFQIMHQG